MPESIESSRFVSHRRMSEVFDSRIDSHSTKASNLCKATFRELCDSKLSGLHAFDNMAKIH